MEQSKESDWIIRLPNEDDISFIYSTWLNSYRYDSSLGKTCRNSVFFRAYTKVIDRLLADPNTIIHIAALPYSQNIALGYSITEKNLIHFVFVKESFRKFGIAKDLLKHLDNKLIVFSHRTKTVEPIIKQHDDWIYDPFVLYI